MTRLGAAVGLVLLTGPSCGWNEHRPPNVLLISIDTLGALHLASTGYDRVTSPRLDALARTGTVFENAISASSWTVPAHATAFTGLEPPAHGLLLFPDVGHLGERAPTLAELLADAGYRTAAFTGGGFVSPRHGFDAGFERFVSRGRRFGASLGEAEAWVEAIPDHDPFFLFLHGFDVHRPYRPPQPFDRMFQPEPAVTDEKVADAMFPLLEDLAVVVGELGPRATDVLDPPDELELARIISQYDGEIAGVDDLLGRFLERLDERGRLENTLVVVMSDHGDELYQHGGVDHIHTLYEELIRVPWFMSGPGVPHAVVDDPVGTIDLMPTVCELAGVPIPDVQGTSRVPLMEAHAADGVPEDGSGATPSLAPDAVFSFTGYSRYPYRVVSVRTDRWKLIRWHLAGMDTVTVRPPHRGDHYTLQLRDDDANVLELYDLLRDPGETRDLATRRPEVVETLSRLIDARLAESRAHAVRPERPRAMTEEYRDALRSLGYIQ